MKMSVDEILGGRDASEVANLVHKAYVEGQPEKQVPAANSYQHFTISTIEKAGEGKFTVAFDSGDKTAPMTGEEIVKTLKGGKFNAGGKKYNTKEALLEERVDKGLEALKLLSKAGFSAKETRVTMTKAIAEGILKDNTAAIQAVYWLSELPEDVRDIYSDTDLLHVYWCLYINWDPDSSDLSKPFPIEDLVTRAKDINVGDSINKALGLGLDFDAPMWDQASEPGNVSHLVDELQNQFSDISDTQAIGLEDYLIARMNGIRPSGDMLESVEEIKGVIQESVKKASDTRLVP